MNVEQILALKGRDVETVWPWITVAQAIRRMAGPPRFGALVVCADAERRVVGMLTERDLITALEIDGAALLDRSVEEVMSRNVPSCSPDDSLNHVMVEMTRSRHRHLPVLAEGRGVGIISIGGVVQHRLHEMELEPGVLRDLYIAGH